MISQSINNVRLVCFNEYCLKLLILPVFAWGKMFCLRGGGEFNALKKCLKMEYSKKYAEN